MRRSAMLGCICLSRLPGGQGATRKRNRLGFERLKLPAPAATTGQARHEPHGPLRLPDRPRVDPPVLGPMHHTISPFPRRRRSCASCTHTHLLTFDRPPLATTCASAPSSACLIASTIRRSSVSGRSGCTLSGRGTNKASPSPGRRPGPSPPSPHVSYPSTFSSLADIC